MCGLRLLARILSFVLLGEDVKNFWKEGALSEAIFLELLQR